MIEEWHKKVERQLITEYEKQNDRVIAELLDIVPIPDFFISEWMPSHRIIQAIDNPNMPTLWRNRLLSRLAERGNIEDRVWVARCEHTPVGILELLAGDISPQVRPVVRLNPNFTNNLLQKVQNDRDLATNWQTSPEILANLAVSKYAWIRLGVAQNINTPSHILGQLLEDKEQQIKLAAMQNTTIPKEYLKAFIDTSDREIIDIIGHHPNAPTAFFKRRLENGDRLWPFIDGNPNFPASILEKLAKRQQFYYLEHPNASVKLISRCYQSDNIENKQIIAKHGNTPINILKYLAKEEDAKTRLLVAENINTPKILREQLLIDLVFEYISGNTNIDYVALINNSEISLLLRQVLFVDVAIDNKWNEDLATALNPFRNELVRKECWEKVLADCDDNFANTLAENRLTPPDILDRLADRFINRRYHNIFYTLIYNPNTSIETFKKLARHPDRDIRRVLAERSNTPFPILFQLSTDNGRDFDKEYYDPNSKYCPFYESVLNNPNLSRLERYQIILRHQEYQEPTPDEIINEQLKYLERLSKNYSDRASVRVQLKLARQAASLKALLNNYARSSIPFLRFVTLIHPLLPEYLFIKASKSTSWIERYVLTLNPALPAAIKQSLTQDTNDIVRASAINNGLADKETLSYQIVPIKPTTENLFASLEAIVERLHSEALGIRSRGGSTYPCQALMWKIAEKGEFSFTKLTIDLGFIIPIIADDFINELEAEIVYYLRGTSIAEKCSDLLDIIESKLDDIQAFEITGKQKFDDSFKIIVGQTERNNWIGIAPLLQYSPEGYSEKFFYREELEFDPEDLELKAEIDSCLDLLELPINPNSYQESIGTICEIAESRDILVEKLLVKAKALSVRSFTEFYDECLEDEEREPQPEYTTLNRFMATFLSDMRYYSMGIWLEASLYFIGKTSQGDYLVILTETSFGH